jgi:hypothetical protein
MSDGGVREGGASFLQGLRGNQVHSSRAPTITDFVFATTPCLEHLPAGSLHDHPASCQVAPRSEPFYRRTPRRCRLLQASYMQPPTSFALEAWVSLHLAVVYHMRTVCSESFALRRGTCQYRNTYTRTSCPSLPSTSSFIRSSVRRIVCSYHHRSRIIDRPFRVDTAVGARPYQPPDFHLIAIRLRKRSRL